MPRRKSLTPRQEQKDSVSKKKTKRNRDNVKATPKDDTPKPKPTVYLPDQDYIMRGVVALRKYMSLRETKDQKKELIETARPIVVEMCFKNMPSNSKTYIHNVVLPHHWRKTLEPEEYNIALFVKHNKPENEAQKIQFDRDRELDIDNTHTYYKELFEKKLSDENRAKISRIITSKELATEFTTPQHLDRLSKTYDLFLADKKLVCNKFNALLRRLGRRFWVRERKVPLSLKMEAPDLNERFEKLMSIEPFYVIGNSSTERIQIGLSNQTNEELVQNIDAFLQKLHQLYGNDVRFIRLRSERGLSMPLFADLSTECPKVVKMRKPSVKRKAIEGDFDLLPDCKVRITAGGTIKVSKKTSANAV